MDDRPFIPETQTLDPEVTVKSVYLGRCDKKGYHKHHIPIHDLSIEHLPEKWRSEHVLNDLKIVAKRVVHLTVIKNNREETGSGFITFHPKHGSVINTSKHVVCTPTEADCTIVRPFYDDDEYTEEVESAIQDLKRHMLISRWSTISQNISDISPFDDQENDHQKLFLFKGSSRYFRSVMCTDYTAFSCRGLDRFFSMQEIERSNAAFSWWKFSLKRLIFSPQVDIDVAVISHPHGGPKKVTFGKMHRLLSVHPSLYSAPTCQGSSGAPVIRLHSQSAHYISAGQFVHHGHMKAKLNLGMGTVRPPMTMPYSKRLDTQYGLANAISILYEPILYWTLVMCDFLHIESTLTSSLDVFAYTSSFSALLCSVDSTWFKFLNWGFRLHVMLTFILRCWKSGCVYALCETLGTLINMSMFIVAWILLHFIPWSVLNMLFVIAVWTCVLYLERYYEWSSRFRLRTMGSFNEQLHYRLAMERRRQSKKVKDGDLITTQSDGARTRDDFKA